MEIVGLKNVVNDDVNQLIAKFVFQSKAAKEIKDRLEAHLNKPANFITDLFFWKRLRRSGYIFKEFRKLTAIKNISQRRDAFLRLKGWLRKSLIIDFWCELFPKNGKNLRFINEQMVGLNIKVMMFGGGLGYRKLEW